MKQYKHFYNNWLDCSTFDRIHSINTDIEYLNTNLDISFFDSLCFDDNSIKQYRLDAAKYCAETLGDKPALCMSGGVDSQAMVQCFYDAGYNFDVYTLVFKNDLNIQDVSYAREYCQKNNIKLHELDFDIVNFLSRENINYALRYRCSSPHFNTHFKMFDILKSMGYTSVVCGGNTPLQTVESNNQIIWGSGYTRNVMSYIRYSEISEFFAQGNFLSFYPNLAWAISIVTHSTDIPQDKRTSQLSFSKLMELSKIRYNNKINGYKRIGFNIIPQETKYTGFELVKKYYEDITGDGWTFEKKFRIPLVNMLNTNDHALIILNLNSDIKTKIEYLHGKYYFSGNSSSGI